jgi:hypothetical protein
MPGRETWIYRTPTSGPVWKRRGVPDLPPYDPGAGGQTDPGTGTGGTGTGTGGTTGGTTAVTPHLPWELTDAMRKQMAAAKNANGTPRHAFGHYFYTFPLAVNNTSDYYKEHWLPIGQPYGGTGSAMSAADKLTGGQLRDRPIPIPAINRAGFDPAVDKAVEVRQAIEAGFDGFMPDFLQVRGTGTVANQRWTQHLELLKAVNLVGDPNFKVVPMVDSYTSGSADPIILADHMELTFKDPASYTLPTGEKVLAAYAPERAPQNVPNQPAVNFWPITLDRLRTFYKRPVNFLACFLDAWTGSSTAQSFDDVAWMFSNWGTRDPAASGANNAFAQLAAPTAHGGTWAGTGLLAQPGKLWMHPVSVQDSRPNQSAFWEAWGFDNLVTTWRAAIDGNADWVQVPTWSDQAEHAAVAPSVNHGWAFLDVFTYFLIRWKLGYYPTIVRDGIYLAHRIHPSTGTTFNGTMGQTKWQTVRGSTPVKDDVCAAVFLTAPATLTFTVGGTRTTPTTANPAPAGFSVHKVPLRAGGVSAEVVRNGVTVAAAVSPFPVATTQVTDDYNYRAVSSLRKAA